MTTGDEPMLPQPSDDNAPMISGRGTKVIADARGAYLAGNLQALIERMDEEQQLRFRKAIAQQTIYYLRQEIHDENSVEFRFLQCVENWIQHGGNDTADEPLQFMIDAGVVLVEPDEPMDYFEGLTVEARLALNVVYVMIEPIEYITDYPLYLAVPRLEIHPINQHNSREWILRRWQVESAWAIFTGRTLPSLDDFVFDDSSALSAAYRRGDLNTLSTYMTLEQKKKFCWALLRAALMLSGNLFSDDPGLALETPLKLAIANWHKDKAAGNDKQAKRIFDREIHQLRNKGCRVHILDFTKLIASPSVVRTSEWLKYEMSRLLRKSDGHSLDPSFMWGVRWWQVEVAWALLQGNEPPTFEIIQ
jgi:hypothetical protein